MLAFKSRAGNYAGFPTPYFCFAPYEWKLFAWSLAQGVQNGPISFYPDDEAATLALPALDPAKDAVNKESFAHRLREPRQFIQGLTGARGGEQLVSPSVAKESLDLWYLLSESVHGDLAIPDAAAGPDGELYQIWKQGDHYLSVEMSPEGKADFFYRNSRTGDIWGFEYDMSDILHPARS